MTRREFANFVYATLADHPEWLHDTLRAVSAGQDEALRRAHEQRAQSDAAMLSALCLAKEGRVSSETKADLLQVISKAIRRNGASPIEREFLARADNAKAD